MNDPFSWADEIGPAKVVFLSKTGLRAVVVIDNTACGPAVGGVRMALDASAEEAFRLARAMTLKNAAAGLAHGGGKSVIVADPRMPAAEKEQSVRAFAGAIASLTEYVPGPDMGTDELAMAWMHDEIHRAVGLPRELGGIPLDEIGATGFGLAVAVEEAAAAIHLTLKGARVAVQGFGAVGQHAARFLTQAGCRLVACSDTGGTLADPDGLDAVQLVRHKRSGMSVTAFPAGKAGSADAILDAVCDIWIPAARPDVLTRANAHRVQAKIVAQGANIPCTLDAEALLEARGVLILPDFIANAGGVICAATEYRGGTEAAAFAAIDEKIRRNTRLVLEEASRRKCATREAAVALALDRVQAAARTRRWR